jgi:hypothetical protein
VANNSGNKVPMSEAPVWARVMRSRTPLVYLDLNHFIFLARANTNAPKTPLGYQRLLAAARSAAGQGRAQVVLSAAHLFEMSAISDPRQRSDIADVMEELSGFHYILGRPQIARLEIEAGISAVLGDEDEPEHLPLVGPSFGRAFGMRGGVSIRNAEGNRDSTDLHTKLGEDAYEQLIQNLNRTFERQMLQGPSDAEAAVLRAQHGYQPELAHQAQASRLEFELDLSKRLEENPRWRRGRLRDVVSGREIAHEWLDAFNEVVEARANSGRSPLDPDDPRVLTVLASMPHVQVAISMKTRYHRNPAHNWTTNDIIDIDALSVAYPYCDVAFSDHAARAALADSPELRPFGAYLPRTPVELADWFDQQPVLASAHLLIPAGRSRRSGGS